MKILLSIIIFSLSSLQIFPQINQGDILINSFDPAIGGAAYPNYKYEFVVLVNRTSSTIDLNGYEIRCFKYNGEFVRPLWQWNNSTQLMPPYGFLLITNIVDSVHGIPADIVNPDTTRGHIDFDGYLTLRKINASQPSDYIDVVKFNSFQNIITYPWTDVPENSGLTLSMPIVTIEPNKFDPLEYATRGGFSSGLDSLIYTGYGMANQSVSDFRTEVEVNAKYIQNSSSSPLPVELSSFSASATLNGEVKLRWRTETEVMNYGFDIERKPDSDDWLKIGFVAGHGNSNIPYEYSFTDNSTAGGKIYYYRLKQIDTDGRFEYSKTVSVNLGKSDNFELSQNFPNPFNPNTTIKYRVKEKSNVKIDIFNTLGKKVITLINEVKNPGNYEVRFEASDMPSGIYIYRVIAGNFVETRKMILMK